jgi:hypothetical protein
VEFQGMQFFLPLFFFFFRMYQCDFQYFLVAGNYIDLIFFRFRHMNELTALLKRHTIDETKEIELTLILEQSIGGTESAQWTNDQLSQLFS